MYKVHLNALYNMIWQGTVGLKMLCSGNTYSMKIFVLIVIHIVRTKIHSHSSWLLCMIACQLLVVCYSLAPLFDYLFEQQLSVIKLLSNVANAQIQKNNSTSKTEQKETASYNSQQKEETK